MEFVKTYFKTCLKNFGYIFIVIIAIFIAIWVVKSLNKDKENNKEITYYYHIFTNNQKLKYIYQIVF